MDVEGPVAGMDAFVVVSTGDEHMASKGNVAGVAVELDVVGLENAVAEDDEGAPSRIVISAGSGLRVGGDADRRAGLRMSTASGYWDAGEGRGWAVRFGRRRFAPCPAEVPQSSPVARRDAHRFAVTTVILMKKQTFLRRIANKNRAPRDLCAIAGCPPFRFVTRTTL